MELFDRLFAGSLAPEPVRDAETASTLVPPMAILGAPPVSLADMLAEDGSITTRSLTEYAALHAPHLQDEFAELARLIGDDDFDLDLDGTSATRLLEYVYPVV
jgi:hypothetical protein